MPKPTLRPQSSLISYKALFPPFVTLASVSTLAALSLILARPVLAQNTGGGWNPTYQADGLSTSELDGYGLYSTPWPDPWPGGFNGSYYGHTLSSGSITATFVWQPYDGQPNLPPANEQQSLIVLEKSDAYINRQSSAGGPLVASDGLDDPLVVSPNNPNRLDSFGAHLIHVPVSQGADGVWRAVLPERQLNVEAGVSSQGTGNGNYTGGSYTVQQDDREVAISSAIETSHYKTEDGDSGHPLQRTHQRSPDGSIAVDSAVDWHSDLDAHNQPTGNVKGWQVNGLPLTANAANFQDPSYAWNLLGLTIPQAWLQLPQTTPKNPAIFYLRELDGNKFPLHCTVRVDVTDTDNAVAANTYDITWHLPYEATAFLGSVPQKVKLEKLYGPIGEGDFSDVQISEARDIDISEGCEIAGGAAAATGQEELAAVLEIAGKLAKLTDAKYHYAGENVHYGTQNGQDKWTATLNNPEWASNVENPDLLNFVDPRTGAYDGWVFCDLDIYEVEHYHHMTWAADKYDSHGYDSSGYTLHADPIDSIDEEPYYFTHPSSNPH